MTSPGRLYQSPQWVDSFQTVSGKSVVDVYEKQMEALIPNLPLAFGREEISFANPLFLKSFEETYLYAGKREEGGRRGLLDYFGARYVLGNGVLAENKSVFPKWFSVQRALGLQVMGNTMIPAIAQADNLAQKCIVTDGTLAGTYGSRKVTETFRSPSGVALEAKGEGKALLVSSETAYPGWKAHINGTAQEWSLVNGGFRGIELKEGEEVVVWNYRPTSFKLGCFLSLLACGLWLGMFLNLGWKKRHA
jgi:hypothetical protein